MFRSDPPADLPVAGPVLVIGSTVAGLMRVEGAALTERDRSAESLLRALTGRTDIVIERRPSGRPRLGPPYPELGVSLSRRGEHTLVGFSPVARVGVDIEPASDPERGGIDPWLLSRDHYAAAETTAIARLERRAALDLFLRLWVAKEAALKITGRGIYDGLGEPDLASAIDPARQDGAMIEVPAGRRVPAFKVAICRRAVAGRVLYCALAVEVPGSG